jgi:hypothetical protein
MKYRGRGRRAMCVRKQDQAFDSKPCDCYRSMCCRNDIRCRLASPNTQGILRGGIPVSPIIMMMCLNLADMRQRTPGTHHNQHRVH